jgi:hypothetical protein
MRVPLPGRLPALSVSWAPALGYAVYLPYILHLSPSHAIEQTQNPLVVAALLSLNFNFVLPLTLPSLAPPLSPVLEALFNATVAYAVLFIGFALDAPGSADGTLASESSVSSDRAALSSTFTPDPFVAFSLLPFLTNIVWLPYLALRVPIQGTTVETGENRQSCSKVPRPMIRALQSKGLPLYSVTVLLASVLYGAVARASPELPVDTVARLHELARLCHEDILSASFAADWCVFAFTQSWLVADDVALRKWSGMRAERASSAALLIPFFGLAWYLLERARDPEATKF